MKRFLIGFTFLLLFASVGSAQLKVAVISDLNGPYGTIGYDWHVDSTIAQIVRMKPDLVLCSGDMIAGQDHRLPSDRFQAMWAEFDRRVLTPLNSAGIPFGFTIGNHDGSPYDNFTRERVVARTFWNNAATGLTFHDRGDFPFYFSYTLNNFFFISWDASSESITDENLAWVRAQLETPAARQANVRIMLGHLPLYAVAEGRNRRGEVLMNPDSLLALMVNYDVDLYVSGHHHAYYPGKRKGVELLLTATLGGGPRSYIGSDDPPRKAWTLLHFDLKRSGLIYQTFDADTGSEIQYDELPVWIRGLNGYTIRRDHLPASRWMAGTVDSGWIEFRRSGDRLSVRGKILQFPDEIRYSGIFLTSDISPEDVITEIAFGNAGDILDMIEYNDLDPDMMKAGMYRILFISDDPAHSRWIPLKPVNP